MRAEPLRKIGQPGSVQRRQGGAVETRSAYLFPRKSRLVDQQHGCAFRRQPPRNQGAGWSCPGNDRVPGPQGGIFKRDRCRNRRIIDAKTHGRLHSKSMRQNQ